MINALLENGLTCGTINASVPVFTFTNTISKAFAVLTTIAGTGTCELKAT